MHLWHTAINILELTSNRCARRHDTLNKHGRTALTLSTCKVYLLHCYHLIYTVRKLVVLSTIMLFFSNIWFVVTVLQIMAHGLCHCITTDEYIAHKKLSSIRLSALPLNHKEKGEQCSSTHNDTSFSTYNRAHLALSTK